MRSSLRAHRRGPRAQTGATLLVSMIFLVVITLLVVSAVKVSTTNTRVVGNLQTQKEADAATVQAIETTISSDFTQMPQQRIHSVDINNSGSVGSTYSVTVQAPECTGVKPIKVSELDPDSEADQSCFVGNPPPNPDGSSNAGNSLCSASNWNVKASAAAPGGGGTSAMTNQGIAVRVAVGAAC